MTDDPTDLMDRDGRTQRLVLALAVGVVLAGLAYLLCTELAEPAEASRGSRNGAFRFVFYMTGFAFATGLGVTLAVLNRLAAKRWRERRIPPAKQIS